MPLAAVAKMNVPKERSAPVALALLTESIRTPASIAGRASQPALKVRLPTSPKGIQGQPARRIYPPIRNLHAPFCAAIY